MRTLTLTLPLHRALPSADLQFSKTVDFGLIVLNQSSIKTLTLRNEGTKSGDFNIVYDTSLPLQITPARGTLQPKGSLQSSTQVQVCTRSKCTDSHTHTHVNADRERAPACIAHSHTHKCIITTLRASTYTSRTLRFVLNVIRCVWKEVS